MVQRMAGEIHQERPRKDKKLAACSRTHRKCASKRQSCLPRGREDAKPGAHSTGLVEDDWLGRMMAAGLRSSESRALAQHPALRLPAPGPEGPCLKGKGQQAKADFYTRGYHFGLVTWSATCL